MLTDFKHNFTHSDILAIGSYLIAVLLETNSLKIDINAKITLSHKTVLHCPIQSCDAVRCELANMRTHLKNDHGTEDSTKLEKLMSLVGRVECSNARNGCKKTFKNTTNLRDHLEYCVFGQESTDCPNKG